MQMPIKVLINGSSGKMGQETVQAISQDKTFELVAAIGKNDNLIAKIKAAKPDVVIDFTTPSAVFENTLAIIQENVRPVIGTTGLSAEKVAELKKLCAEKKLGGIIAPNFSIAAMLMMQFAKTAAEFFPEVEIIEFHHTGKKDSPSGTALKTAQMIAENRKIIPEVIPQHETIPGARGAVSHHIPIHAVRLPGFLAVQEVLFGGLGETLGIKHTSIHRQAFMPGVVLACKKVMGLSELVYGLENVL